MKYLVSVAVVAACLIAHGTPSTAITRKAKCDDDDWGTVKKKFKDGLGITASVVPFGKGIRSGGATVGAAGKTARQWWRYSRAAPSSRGGLARWGYKYGRDAAQAGKETAKAFGIKGVGMTILDGGWGALNIVVPLEAAYKYGENGWKGYGIDEWDVPDWLLWIQ